MEKSTTTNTTKYSHIVVKAWQDEEFKQKLIKDPVNTLREEGIDIPAGVNVTVCEETNNQHFLFLPEKPEGELSAHELEAIAGDHGEHQMGTEVYYNKEDGELKSGVLK